MVEFECVADSCGDPAEYAGAYRLSDRKIILHFCELHFDETNDVPLSADGGAAVCEPVGLVEIAERLGVKRGTAKQWHHRRLLPAPRWVVSGAPAWDWSAVERWARESGRLPSE